MKIISADKRCFMSEIDPKGCIFLTAVLTEGTIGDHAVYIGQGTEEFVAMQGNKLKFEEAKIYFPGIKKENYRG